jgi:hypothetical protein
MFYKLLLVYLISQLGNISNKNPKASYMEARMSLNCYLTKKAKTHRLTPNPQIST